MRENKNRALKIVFMVGSSSELMTRIILPREPSPKGLVGVSVEFI